MEHHPVPDAVTHAILPGGVAMPVSIEYALVFAFACFGLALLFNLWRVMFAPGVTDRVLALDTMSINMIALLTLFGIYHGTAVFYEASMLFAMVGFVSTVAYAKFILRGDIIE